jgi:vacuolar protein sorting-associated protein 33A
MATGKEEEIILPPPSARNPIPSLSAALRVDNQEQLLDFLLQAPPDYQHDKNTGGVLVSSTTTGAAVVSTSSSSASSSSHQFKQWLVFANEQMRTLIMRQVLSDPHGRKWSNPHKNWDADTTFPFAPKSVTGTFLLDHNGTTAPLEQQQQQMMMTNNIPDVMTYFLRPDETILPKLAAHVAQYSGSNSNNSNHKNCYHRIVFLPQIPALTQTLLNEMGLAPLYKRRVSIHNLQLDLFPLEGDLYSMECNDCFRQLTVDGTPSCVITDTARSILKVQDIIGTIPRIQAYGSTAEEVVKKTLSMAVEEHLANPAAYATDQDVTSNSVAALIIIDRKIDLVTPLLTPLTYEGLLDDVLGVDCGFLHIQSNLINSSSSSSSSSSAAASASSSSDNNNNNNNTEPPERIALAVNEADTLFSEIRNLHVEKFGSFLQYKARELEKTKKDFSETGRDKPLGELQKFVRQLPTLQYATRSLTNHVNLAEVVKRQSETPLFRERWHMERAMIEGDLCLDDLDDLVASEYEPFRFLRLLCLQSICKNGISSSRYDSLRRDIVQTYGYEYLFFLGNLEKAGLLRRKEAFLGMDKPSRFARLKDLLRLIVPDVDTVDPDDISFVSSGYAPLTVRLIQSAAHGWKNGGGSRDEILREIPGRFLDILQQYPPEDLAATLKRPLNTGTAYGSLEATVVGTSTTSATTTTTTTIKPVLLVWYVGGVTTMELAALRFLSNDVKFPYHIICCTTKIMNGTSLLQSLQ